MVSQAPQQVAAVKLGSHYCSDPKCESCKQLRETEERITRNNDGSRVAKRVTA